MGLEKFVEALADPESGLTYPALTGARKQSVEDVERLFGAGVLKFMTEHGYTSEAQYVKVIRNWRRAVDERGLQDEERKRMSSDCLEFVLSDLIPWSTGKTDLRLLEVNR